MADATDAFALDNSELGCTDLEQQVIDTDNHPLINTALLLCTVRR